MKYKLTLTEEMLGTKAANKDVFADFIASKAPDDDARRQELETAEHREEAGTTVFHRDPATGQLMIWDYQIKGFLKEAGDVLRQAEDEPATDEETGKKPRKRWGAARGKIDNFVRVTPRMIPLGVKEPDGVCERPLRAQTAMGPRVALARSELVNAGRSFEIKIELLPGGPITQKMIEQCLDYGTWKGLGQWRNSGKGRFKWERIEG